MKFFTVKEVTKTLAVDRRTVWRWMAKGLRGVKLGYTCVGGRRRIPEDALQKFLAETQRGEGDPAVVKRHVRVQAARMELVRRYGYHRPEDEQSNGD